MCTSMCMACTNTHVCFDVIAVVVSSPFGIEFSLMVIVFLIDITSDFDIISLQDEYVDNVDFY